MSNNMNNMTTEYASDITDSGSDTDDEMVEADPVVLADLAEIQKKTQGPMKKYQLKIFKSFNEAIKTTEKVNNAKVKLKQKFKCKARMLKQSEQKLRDVEQSREFWKTEAEKRKVAEEKLKDENNQQALTIKNLKKELEKYKQEIREVKTNLECKLKDSESRYENLRRMSEEEGKKWKGQNKQLQDKLSASERTKRDLEINMKGLHVQISNLENGQKRLTSEKEQILAEKVELQNSESQLKTELANKAHTINKMVTEELERRMQCATMNEIILQNQAHFNDFLMKKNLCDANNLAYIMPPPGPSGSSLQKRTLTSNSEGGEATAGKKTRTSPPNSGQVSEEEGEIPNQQPQQEASMTLATQPVAVPIPVVPAGPSPQTVPRHIDNATSANANATQFQTIPNPITALNSHRDSNRRSGDWNKYSGGRGRKH